MMFVYQWHQCYYYCQRCHCSHQLYCRHWLCFGWLLQRSCIVLVAENDIYFHFQTCHLLYLCDKMRLIKEQSKDNGWEWISLEANRRKSKQELFYYYLIYIQFQFIYLAKCVHYILLHFLGIFSFASGQGRDFDSLACITNFAHRIETITAMHSCAYVCNTLDSSQFHYCGNST